MLKNYLTIAWRNLKRNKSYTFINIGGLAIGLACCILIALYVRDELSHDDFHKYADRLVMVGTSHTGNHTDNTPYPLSDALEQSLTSVATAVRVKESDSDYISVDGKNIFDEEKIYYAGKDFFTMFSFPVIKGIAFLKKPNTAVISKKLAKKLFGNENSVGQILTVKEPTFFNRETFSRDIEIHDYKITGVARSRDNSYLDFNVLLSLNTLDYLKDRAGAWRSFSFTTFALLEKNTSVKTFTEQMELIRKTYLPEDDSDEAYTRFFAIPITQLYFSELVSPEGFHGKWKYIYLFGAVALFILIIAFVNYINLSTARAGERSREIGVRKTTGATRAQLLRQFLSESVLMSGIAFLLSLVLAPLALPIFNDMFGMSMIFNKTGIEWFLLLGASALCAGLLAGAYPALYLSSFNPALVFKKYSGTGRSGPKLRKSLVVLQFIIATTLIITTAIVLLQLRFTQEKDLGFSGENVVTTYVPEGAGNAFKQKILGHPAVISASVNGGIPGNGFNVGFGPKPKEISAGEQTIDSKTIQFNPAVVDYDYIETLNMKIIDGRNFSSGFSSDKKHAYIINKTAAAALGWTSEEAVGKPFSPYKVQGEVIGVVKDFHYESFHKRIGAIILHMSPAPWFRSPMSIAVKLKEDALQAGLQHIKKVKAQFTDEPFKYALLDEQVAEMYKEERRLGNIFSGFAAIAVILACMGLYGLAAFAAQRRTKEIGIRKVMGATVPNIVGLLSKDFLKLVLIGFVIAVPKPISSLPVRRWPSGVCRHSW